MGFVSVAVPFDDNWYFDRVVSGVRSALAAAGHEIALHLVPYSPAARATVTDRFDEDLADPAAVGAIALTYRLERDQVARLRRHGRPLVLAGGTSPGLPSVRVDDVAAARLATEHLIRLGHRSIAHIAGYAFGPDDSTMRSDRVRGYSEAMRSAGLEDLSRVRPCEFRTDAARRVAVEMLSADRPTAILGVNDEIAIGVLHAAAELGLAVPGDLSVIGIDDQPSAAELGLTTLHQDPADTGTAAVDRLLERVVVDDQVIGMQLVERTSTAPPAAPRRAGPLARLLRRRRLQRADG